MSHPPDTVGHMAHVTQDGLRIKVDGLEVEDGTLAALLSAQPEERWPEMIERALLVGARGLVSMEVGLTLDQVEDRVRATVEEVLAAAQHHARGVLGEANSAILEHLDPDQRSSLVARTLRELHLVGQSLLDGLDPQRADSHTARFVEQMTALLGVGGQLEQRLQEALDPHLDGSGLAELRREMDRGLRELRDLLMVEQGRRSEAERGTAKGVTFEDTLEEALRRWAAAGGCVVERTSRSGGDLAPDALVGDFVVHLPSGRRIVVEAKNAARLTLTGRDGMLAELDRCLDNRAADFAICVSARDAYPAEVGAFGVYGRRVLVVDPGDGTMTAVALRWAATMLEAAAADAADFLDAAAVLDRLERLRGLATRFSATKRGLTEAQTAIDGSKSSLDGLRAELLDLVEDIGAEIRRACDR